MNRFPSPRGSALVITLIALAVLLLMVVGTITFTGRNRTAAVANIRNERVEACAETARRYLLSRMQVYGAFAAPIQDLKLEQVLMDDAEPADRSTMRTGHFGANPADAGTTAVLSSSSFGSAKEQVSDAANTLREGMGGGGYYRVVVMCDEPSGRQAETEFVFRFGI
ncbi:hypothetical protein [Myxococcus sp. RHSTA-1-4]|uniref:hypothetical protein n=1 Tax=Myxococcus sp. RHSTA-1-4 TaxID=2874601 RepID=UPI001CC04201|nr:hypothetical protein [Myxococcus sp. RHSTA-1-4]MBZ4414921.1 hypothetical protein [Myxococcus sp. RHSTA-1-4]